MSRTRASSRPGNADAALRLFFAVWPDPGAREALAGLARDIAIRARGRAPAAENLHITLAFLGDVAPTRVAAVRALGLAATAVPPFTLTLDRVGVFPKAGIAWAGASVMPPELERLEALLSGALAREGFNTERRAFAPHLTLARRCRTPISAAIPAPIAWKVERIVLNASETLPSGPRYRVLADWSLGPPALVIAASQTCG